MHGMPKTLVAISWRGRTSYVSYNAAMMRVHSMSARPGQDVLMMNLMGGVTHATRSANEHNKAMKIDMNDDLMHAGIRITVRSRAQRPEPRDLYI